MTTVIAFRHGVYEHNKRIDLTGKAAEAAMQEKVSENIDYEADLSDDGIDQAHRLQAKLKLAAPAIELCMVSPYKRAGSTAAIGLDSKVPKHNAPGLRERDLGAFRDLPREKFHQQHAKSAAEKKRHPLTWKPLPAPGRPGESLVDTGERAVKEIRRGLSLARTGIIALSTHMDVMVALRGHRDFGGLTNTTIQQPLYETLQNPLWVPNVAIDMYTDTDPTSGRRHPGMRFFRHINTIADTDTDWLDIRR